LTLGQDAGQVSRVLTGYDILLLSVLVEAQAGATSREPAGRCALRAMRKASVVPSAHPAARMSAAAALLAGGMGLLDKAEDADLPAPSLPLARRLGNRLVDRGSGLAREVGLDSGSVLDAAAASSDAEQPGRSLDFYLEASGRVVSLLFAYTAELAGRPRNTAPLQRAGAAFGQLMHLIDAVTDYRDDLEKAKFNPLSASATPAGEARKRAEERHAEIRAAMEQVDMPRPDLARSLFGPVLATSIRTAFEPASVQHRRHHRPPSKGAAASSARPGTPPREPSRGRRARPRDAGGQTGTGAMAAATGLGLLVANGAAMIGGGWGQRGRWRGRRGGYNQGPYYGDPYYGGYPPSRGFGGFRMGGPSCCDMLACDCCANMACNDCCGGDGCVICC
jgi:hypothetical protein